MFCKYYVQALKETQGPYMMMMMMIIIIIIIIIGYKANLG
jgi:hypothetical protein